MNYIKVKWIHSHKDEPALLFSELDDDRRETRKIELWSDGKMGYADKHKTSTSPKTVLGEVPLPELSEIARDPEFDPIVITKGEFEEIWRKATE